MNRETRYSEERCQLLSNVISNEGIDSRRALKLSGSQGSVASIVSGKSRSAFILDDNDGRVFALLDRMNIIQTQRGRSVFSFTILDREA